MHKVFVNIFFWEKVDSGYIYTLSVLAKIPNVYHEELSDAFNPK